MKNIVVPTTQSNIETNMLSTLADQAKHRYVIKQKIDVSNSFLILLFFKKAVLVLKIRITPDVPLLLLTLLVQGYRHPA